MGSQVYFIDLHATVKENFLDKFRTIYPKVDWEIQLAYGEQLGLGRRDYELVRI